MRLVFILLVSAYSLFADSLEVLLSGTEDDFDPTETELGFQSTGVINSIEIFRNLSNGEPDGALFNEQLNRGNKFDDTLLGAKFFSFDLSHINSRIIGATLRTKIKILDDSGDEESNSMGVCFLSEDGTLFNSYYELGLGNYHSTSYFNFNWNYTNLSQNLDQGRFDVSLDLGNFKSSDHSSNTDLAMNQYNGSANNNSVIDELNAYKKLDFFIGYSVSIDFLELTLRIEDQPSFILKTYKSNDMQNWELIESKEIQDEAPIFLKSEIVIE